ncbi:MAG: hypothetical protein QOC73_1037 [Actinomycetota bacterium]|nr:hypothetical protein [Actinomycetota bacterium]
MVTAAGMSDVRAITSAPLWSHTAVRYAELAPRSQAKPTGRQTVREPARRIPGRYDQGRPPERSLNQTDIRAEGVRLFVTLGNGCWQSAGWRPSAPATTRHVHERCAGDGLIGPDDLIEALIEDSRFGACAGENRCFRPPWCRRMFSFSP